jgi:hypothetical protein
MRAKEFILKEDILNEADWNKVKSAILGGVLSLSALGAPNLQAKDIASMSGEEIKQYVIQNSQVKNKQEILDVINMLGQDKNREQNITAQPTARPVATPAATQTPTPVAAPAVTAQPQNTNLSEFSIKGLRFGMTKDQVAEVLKQNNIGGNLGQGLGRFFGALAGANQSNTVDINFGSLLGVSEGTGMMGELEFSNDGYLQAIMLTPRTDIVAEISQRLAMKYGQPEVEDRVWQNKIGNRFDNKVYRWRDVGGASIGAILRGNNRDYGMIGILDSNRLKNAHAQDTVNMQKSLGDF